MLHPAQKIAFATLVLAIGWGLSWPFRKASHSAMEATRTLGDPTPWSTLASDRKAIDTPTALASTRTKAKVPGTMSHTTRTAMQATPGMNFLSATATTPKMVTPRRGLKQPQVRQVAKPVTLIPISQHSEPPRALQRGRPPEEAAAIPRHTANGLPTSMPNHYEPEYSFPQKNGPHNPGFPSEEYRPHPAYATVTDRLAVADNTASQWPDEILHEIQNSDTLEKLAQHYLGDSARALEIFDLNRDKLKNPEILPIGAELRIPATGRRTND